MNIGVDVCGTVLAHRMYTNLTSAMSSSLPSHFGFRLEYFPWELFHVMLLTYNSIQKIFLFFLSFFSPDNHKEKKLFIIISIAIVAVVLVIFIARYCMVMERGETDWLTLLTLLSICTTLLYNCAYFVKSGEQTNRNKNFEAGLPTSSPDSNAIILNDESRIVNIQELPLFTFEMLADATDKTILQQIYGAWIHNGRQVFLENLMCIALACWL